MERERIKPIILTDTETGKEYTLEFNRASIKLAESMGFRIKTADETPVTSFETLWYCAFKMHHPEITPKKANEVFDKLDDKKTDGETGEEAGSIMDELIQRLFDLYLAGSESLSDKNPKVTVIL